jgi:hypothetical protein
MDMNGRVWCVFCMSFILSAEIYHLHECKPNDHNHTETHPVQISMLRPVVGASLASMTTGIGYRIPSSARWGGIR